MRKKKLEFIESENGCFTVTSHRLNRDGYCYLYHDGRQQRAHRLIYSECFGEIPNGLVVRHKCDNPSCINPEHLETGTHKENTSDAIKRGRTATGEKNGRSMINDNDAKEIKIMLSNGVVPRKIARILGVSYKSVHGISESDRWSHIVV